MAGPRRQRPCAGGWPCCTVNLAHRGPMSPNRRSWNAWMNGSDRSWMRWPQENAPPESIWLSRCGGCCPGRRPRGWMNWRRNGCRCPAAPGCGWPTRNLTTTAGGRWWPSNSRNASAGQGRPPSPAAGSGYCSICFPRLAGHWLSPTTWPLSGLVPTIRCVRRCAGGTRSIPGRKIPGPPPRRHGPRPDPRAGSGRRADPSPGAAAGNPDLRR